MREATPSMLIFKKWRTLFDGKTYAGWMSNITNILQEKWLTEPAS